MNKGGIGGHCHEIPWDLKKLPSLISNLVYESCSLSFHPESPNILMSKAANTSLKSDQSEICMPCVQQWEQERKSAGSGKRPVGIPEHPKLGIVVPLQAVGYIPFLARCFSPKTNARECMEVIQVFPLCAQHTGTQSTALLSSGDVQAVGKRHARQYHAEGAVMQKVRPRRGHSESGQERQAGRWLTHPSLGKLRAC